MKKIITLSLLALMVGANIPTNVKAEQSMAGKVGSVALYPFKKVGSSANNTYQAVKQIAPLAKHSLIATKKLALAGLELTKGTMALSAVVVSLVAIACGVDYALLWATEIGLPETIFNSYTFGTFYNSVYTILEPIVAASPEFFASIPERFTNISDAVAALPGFIGA